MTKRKKIKPKAKEQVLSPSPSWNEFGSEESLLQYPGRDQWKQRVISTLLAWAEEDEAKEIQQFHIKFKIYKQRLNSMLDDHPELREAYEQAKFILASKRRINALERKWDKDMVKYDLHRYDEEYNEVNKYHAQMRNIENAQETGIRVVYLEPAPRTDIKHRKTKEPNDPVSETKNEDSEVAITPVSISSNERVRSREAEDEDRA